MYGVSMGLKQFLSIDNVLSWAAYRTKNLTRHVFTGKAALMLTAMIVLLFFLRVSLKMIAVVAVLGTAASLSTIYKRYIKLPSAIELVTFGTVMTSIAYGPFIGAVFGSVTTLISEIVSAAVDMNTFMYIISRAVIGIVAFYIQGMNIVLLGIIGVVIFGIISTPLYILAGDFEAKWKAVYFLTINALFNLLVFSLLGKAVLGIIV
ncbi:hypothetical protein HYU15_04005 [Candidatus Woesearchaeota archaeon]|nr:hypothetical protein [Candidatus Woesearchaeota archaeon]